MSVAVIDIGTNSTRLLVAEQAASGGGLVELEREGRVTRLGRGVDTSGQLAPEAIEDVCDAVSDWLELAGGHRPERIVALATSAVRDAANGGAFLAELRERFALDARVIDGLLEARLTYRGATCGRDPEEPTLVFDIGGGSTEVVIGSGGEVSFHESLDIGVVRQSERFLSADPPAQPELEALADSLSTELSASRARYGGPTPAHTIAVAGTPTSLAAIELELDPYNGAAVEGHTLDLGRLPNHLSRLASIPLAERREIIGLHPDRAETIVCGVVILISTMRAFGVERAEVSEQDILWGAALAAADPDDPL